MAIDYVNVALSQSAIGVRFDQNVKVDSLTADKFSLFLDGATPVEIANAFEEITTCDDFDSLRRMLILYPKVNLDAGTDYILATSGIEYAGRGVGDDDSFPFTTQTAIEAAGEPEPEPVVIEDHSIKSVLFSDEQFGNVTTDTSGFRLESSDPETGEYYIEPDYEDGKLTLTFSDDVDASFADVAYIKVQRKVNQTAPARWEKVTPEFVTNGNEIYVSFPAVDDDSIYNTSGHDYFEVNYTYRVKLSPYIASDSATPSTLGAGVELKFSSGFDPLYVDPELIGIYLDDADNLEIAQIIHKFSAEVLALFPKGDHPALALDYIQAATLCSLSRIHEGVGASNYNGFTLGDLQVMSTTKSGSSSSGTDRGNIISWCELAELLRKELRNAKGGIKSTVKAGAWGTPVPSRHLQRAEYRRRCK